MRDNKSLQPYMEALRTRFKEADVIQAKEKLAQSKQLTVLSTRLDRLKKLYLDGDFTREEYLAEKQSIEMEQKSLENKIAELSTNNNEVVITVEYLLDLLSRINSLYESSRIDKKRRILKLVFSNFFLKGSNISYELKRPFDMIVKRSDCLFNWRQGDEILTNNAYEIYEMYPYLVEMKKWLDELDLQKTKP